jgi:hypothetical protein
LGLAPHLPQKLPTTQLPLNDSKRFNASGRRVVRGGGGGGGRQEDG